jgi:hypothetical protein
MEVRPHEEGRLERSQRRAGEPPAGVAGDAEPIETVGELERG